MISQLITHRELIYTLVKRDLKVRYKASTLGFLWSFGRPLLLMLVMWAVFSVIMRTQTEIPYSLHLLTGILPWMFFQGAIMEAQSSILANASVVKKVSLPTEAFPISTVISNLVHLVLAFLILFGFILFYTIFKDPLLFPGWEIIFLPLLILLQAAILIGISLILSSLYVFYRDVGSISEIVLTAWFYLTPVIYPMQKAREQLKGLTESDALYYLYLCNPMTPVILGYRRVFFGRHLRISPEVADSTLLIGLGMSCIFALAVLWIGTALFNRLSRRFADEL
ncbi:ABC transporter permease [soil metagenome]